MHFYATLLLRGLCVKKPVSEANSKFILTSHAEELN
jgi:hypothetical protein